MTVCSSLCSVAKPAIIYAKMPFSLHRFQRLYSVLCGPYSLGASRQRKPLRLIKTIPLRTRRSSTRGLPWDFGKQGSGRTICASVSQKRSLMLQLAFRAVNHAERLKSMGSEPRNGAISDIFKAEWKLASAGAVSTKCSRMRQLSSLSTYSRVAFSGLETAPWPAPTDDFGPEQGIANRGACAANDQHDPGLGPVLVLPNRPVMRTAIRALQHTRTRLAFWIAPEHTERTLNGPFI